MISCETSKQSATHTVLYCILRGYRPYCEAGAEKNDRREPYVTNCGREFYFRRVLPILWPTSVAKGLPPTTPKKDDMFVFDDHVM